MYFLAIETLGGRKAVNRWLYPTKREAEEAARGRDLIVMDAEHDPGRSILKARHGFS